VYVEKPFTLTAAEATAVIAAAQQAGRTVCAGHQLLFEPVARRLSSSMWLIGRVVHVESYFSFRTVRTSRDGRSILSPVEQLLDILPHPVYTLVEALRANEPGVPAEMTALEVRPEGEVHALLRAGTATGVLVVTLRGRPIESYLRVIGTNGFLRADFVRGALTSLCGPGTSAISIISNPYREAKQIAIGSTRGFASRIFGRKKGYPGLTELAEAFYTSISQGSPPPLSPASILETVRICESVGEALRSAESARERAAEITLKERTRELPPVVQSKGTVLVTGGSGVLGRAVVRELRQHGWPVRSVSRRVPAPSAREAGVEYVTTDLGGALDLSLFDAVTTVVHCAAETAGDRAAHERNTVMATRNLLDAATASGVASFVHISSIAVLQPGGASGSGLDEHSPVDVDNPARGPYVWAKAQAEHDVAAAGRDSKLQVRIIRPGPLVDFGAYEPPGRLGREIGPVFVAVGPRSGRLPLCDIHTAAKVIRAAVSDPHGTPPVINLVEPQAPSRDELLSLWLGKRPDLRSVWLPAWVLAVLSPAARFAQRVLRPRNTPIDIAAAFSSERYDTAVAERVIRGANAGAESSTPSSSTLARSRTAEANLA
jgi:nucleoside-diphosphate-sugar epimerase/predicted dehydrogenase